MNEILEAKKKYDEWNQSKPKSHYETDIDGTRVLYNFQSKIFSMNDGSNQIRCRHNLIKVLQKFFNNVIKHFNKDEDKYEEFIEPNGYIYIKNEKFEILDYDGYNGTYVFKIKDYQKLNDFLNKVMECEKEELETFLDEELETFLDEELETFLDDELKDG